MVRAQSQQLWGRYCRRFFNATGARFTPINAVVSTNRANSWIVGYSEAIPQTGRTQSKNKPFWKARETGNFDAAGSVTLVNHSETIYSIRAPRIASAARSNTQKARLGTRL